MIPRDEYLKLPLQERLIPLNPEQEARVDELHKNSLVIDLHSLILEEELLAQNFIELAPRIQRSRVDGFIEAVDVFDENFDLAMERLARDRRKIEKHPDFMLALRAQDFVEAKKKGKEGEAELKTLNDEYEYLKELRDAGIQMANKDDQLYSELVGLEKQIDAKVKQIDDAESKGIDDKAKEALKADLENLKKQVKAVKEKNEK